MSCPVESDLRLYESQLDQLVSENNEREKYIEAAHKEASLNKIPKDHLYSWVLWYVDQSIYRAKEGFINEPTVKEFYLEVKKGLVDLYEDKDEEPTDYEMIINNPVGIKYHDGC